MCLFLPEMTHHEQDPYYYKRYGDEEDDLQAYPDGLVHAVVVHVDYRGEYDPDNCEDQPPYELPFPGNKQEGEQNKRWDEVHQEITQLLPDGHTRLKGIQCKHADEQNGQYTKDPGEPVKYPDGFVCRGCHHCNLGCLRW